MTMSECASGTELAGLLDPVRYWGPDFREMKARALLGTYCRQHCPDSAYARMSQQRLTQVLLTHLDYHAERASGDARKELTAIRKRALAGQIGRCG
jgi:hypothetical protein